MCLTASTRSFLRRKVLVKLLASITGDTILSYGVLKRPGQFNILCTTMSASHDPDGVCDGDEPRHAKARADGYHDVVRTPEAARRLALLWEEPEPAARGRKPRFVLAEVVTAGLRVVEREGLAGLSMRQVAKELGVGTMSLYTYVPGRAELIDLMIDRAYGELDLPQSPGPWRAGLSQYALEHYRLYLTHPWILQTNMWRSPLAPNVLDAQESGLSTDRKSTRLNSSHVAISYAVFCLKKKK